MRGKILLLTGIFCILSLFWIANVSSSATWWDDNWNYRKQVDIANNVNTTLYNYSMNISLNTAELISQGKMQNDCGDIRIIENGEEINYGIKNCNSDNTEIYFRANDLVIGDNDDLYIYYGNSQANNGFVSNWKDAFYIWYDDFNTDRGWDNCPGNTKSGTVTVDMANSWLYASYGSYTDYHVCPADGSSFPMDGRVGFKAETRIMAENDNLCQIQVMLGDSSYSPKISIPNFRVGHNDYTLLWSDWVSKDLHDDVWYETTAVYNRLTGAWYAEFADDGVKSGTRIVQPDDDFSNIMLDICNGINMYLDYIYLRYFIEPEPSYSLDEEEAVGDSDLVYVNPSYKKTVINRNFTIDVSIDSIHEVYAAHIELYFNSTILNALGVAEGDFLKKDGANTFSVINISNDEGKITFANTRFGVSTGVTGQGILASITFETLYGGISDLDLKNIELSDPDFESIPVLTEDGIVEVRFLEGDVDNNCVVNIFDLAMVGKAYGKQPGDPDWNTDADLTGDGIINIFDLATVGLNYGRTC